MTTPSNTEWSLTAKILKRFIFCYLVLYIFPYGFEYIFALNTDDLSFWTPIVPWFGETFFGISYDTENLAKGFDSRYDYTRFLLCAVLSVMATFAWLWIDSKHKLKYDERLNALLRTILRYHVGLTLILYGIAKVFPLQFGTMGIDRLETVIGDHVPMSFLWTFMSYSRFYTFCAGFIEVIGGLLLLFRATTFIGAVICFIGMANVVLMDIGYDVSVKMFAIHLLLMVVILLMDDMKRLMQFFILNKHTRPAYYRPLLTGNRSKKIGHILKGAILIYFSITIMNQTTERLGLVHDQRYASLSRMHVVEKFAINGDTLPPLLTDTVRWKSISIGGVYFWPDRLLIKNMDNSRERYSFTADTLHKMLVFHPLQDSTDKYFMRYEQRTGGYFIMHGKHKNDSIWIKTKSTAVNEYTLTKSRIKWLRN